MRSIRAVAWVAFPVLVLLRASPAGAALCQVPSGPYPTIQSAVDAPLCTEIELAAQTFEESVVIPRDLEMRGASTTTTVIAGQVTVQGGATQVALEDLTVDASAPGVGGSFDQALLVAGGAEVNGLRIQVLNATEDSSAIFSDGFESGDTSAWSSVVP
jgi:hypothetical protein